MNNLLVNFKREYWEYRKILWGIPLLLSAVIMFASFAVTMSSNSSVAESASAPNAEILVDDRAQEQDDNDETPQTEADKQIILEQLKAGAPDRFMAFYTGFAWLIGLYYLLSSLYDDRKDKSILYWKSLPVSETQNVLTKLLFGVFAFAGVYILIAVLVYSVLSLLGLGLMVTSSEGDQWHYVERTFNFSKLVVWPWVTVLIGFLWGAPVFCYVLMVSAMAKRSPFLLLTVPILCFTAIEAIFTKNSPVSGFFIEHLPFAVPHSAGHGASPASLLNTYLIEHGASMMVGLIVSAVFIGSAVWYRNNRFEI